MLRQLTSINSLFDVGMTNEEMKRSSEVIESDGICTRWVKNCDFLVEGVSPCAVRIARSIIKYTSAISIT